jgi:hypothetical protein
LRNTVGRSNVNVSVAGDVSPMMSSLFLLLLTGSSLSVIRLDGVTQFSTLALLLEIAGNFTRK